MKQYLIKITIPSVQEIIVQSRKLIDLYGSSSLIPTVLSKTFKHFLNNENVKFLIPSEEVIRELPENITNVAYIKYKAKDKEEVKNFCKQIEEAVYENLIDTLKLEQSLIKNYESLTDYQIRNSLKVVYGAVEIKESLSKAKKEVDKLVAYLKGALEPDFESIEGLNYYKKENNIYFEKDFLEFLNNQKNFNYIHVLGAYRCSVCGRRSVIGAKLTDIKGKKFWEDLSKKKYPIIGESERLCGFCLSKRLYRYDKAAFRSVVYYAIKEYPAEVEQKLLEIVKKYEIKDIQNIYDENYKNPELSKFFEEHGYPSKYYALLMADGDSMGEKVENAFKSESSVLEFTKELSSYSQNFKKIIKNLRGETIYTGGDDVLAIFPKSKALEGYKNIFDKFKGTSTMSAGIVIAHYKIPLSYVLKQLRNAEQTAKNKGKKGVCIKYIKHSYSSAECFLKREEIEDFEEIVKIMQKKDFPNTFINQLEAILKPFSELEKIGEYQEQVKSLIKYLINKKKFNDRETFEEILLKQDISNVSVSDIVGKLKVAKFLAARGG
ncbi:MAG: type III-B CRISPR-associated protein Cas10/Cmr2 [Sulfurihydrogenibium sp.]|uniref:type III-B CRISPR-associated protein Cas10/Cmr2 n=1 Tax=Sulfurihydrogenibium sp. TaxID=2053621 RepID=UPI003C7A57B8